MKGHRRRLDACAALARYEATTAILEAASERIRALIDAALNPSNVVCLADYRPRP